MAWVCWQGKHEYLLTLLSNNLLSLANLSPWVKYADNQDTHKSFFPCTPMKGVIKKTWLSRWERQSLLHTHFDTNNSFFSTIYQIRKRGLYLLDAYAQNSLVSHFTVATNRWNVCFQHRNIDNALFHIQLGHQCWIVPKNYLLTPTLVSDPLSHDLHRIDPGPPLNPLPSCILPSVRCTPYRALGVHCAHSFSWTLQLWQTGSRHRFTEPTSKKKIFVRRLYNVIFFGFVVSI